MNSEKRGSGPLSRERVEISALLWDSNQGKLNFLFPWNGWAGNAECRIPRGNYTPGAFGKYKLEKESAGARHT